MCAHESATLCARRSEVNLRESGLCFHSVDHRDQTRSTRLDGKHLSLLSHLASLWCHHLDMALKVPHIEGSASSSLHSGHHELKACSESFATINQHEPFPLVSWLSQVFWYSGRRLIHVGFCMQAFKLVKCECIQFIDTIDHVSAPVRMTAHLWMQLHVCACMCLEVRRQSQLLFPRSCLPGFLRQFVTGWSQLGRLVWLASDPRHLPMAGSAVLELQICTTTLGLFLCRS